jgi:hypothetical protein
MTGPSPSKKLSIRHEATAAIVNERFQGLPWPHNQHPRHDLIRELNAHLDDVIEAAYAVANAEQRETENRR